MDNIYIKATVNSPKVVLDYQKGVIELDGKCYPENTLRFFEPLIKWIEHYFSELEKKTVINIKLSYFNSATNQALFDIFDIIQNSNYNLVEINWFYDSDNIDFIDEYEDYVDEFKKLNIRASVYK